MLTIHTELVEAMLAQARKDHPLETCGIIAGPEGSKVPQRLIPMRNAACSESFFEFDPQQQLRVWREMTGRGEEAIVIYHSHTASPAYPSHSDIDHALDPHVHYVIISTDPRYENDIRSFRIMDGAVTEERVRPVGDYQFGLAPLSEAYAI